MRNKYLLLALGLLFIAGTAFAGGSKEGGATAGTTIKYMAVAEPISDFIRTEIVPGFTKETGINVQIDTTDYVKLHDKEVLELLAGNYDVYQIDQIWVKNYIKNKWVEPLDGLVKAAKIELSSITRACSPSARTAGPPTPSRSPPSPWTTTTTRTCFPPQGSSRRRRGRTFWTLRKSSTILPASGGSRSGASAEIPSPGRSFPSCGPTAAGYSMRR